MKAKNILKSKPFSGSINCNLNDAALIMWENLCSALPVTNDAGNIVGIISDRDIAKATLRQGRQLTDIQVCEVMSMSVIACDENDDIEHIQFKMKVHNVKRMPVLNSQKQLVGMISMNEIADAFDKD